MDLTTLERFRAMWEVTETLITTATLTAYLERLITAWSARAVKVLDRQVATGTYTEYLDVEPGQRVFALKAYPVSSVVSVESDATREFSGTTVSADLYSCQTGTGLVRFDLYCPDAGPGSLKVTYAGGMGASAASFAANYPDIADAIDTQVAYAFERKTSFGKTAVSVGQGQVSYQSALDWLPQVRNVLLAHRRMVVV